jgi:hypothetical protein
MRDVTPGGLAEAFAVQDQRVPRPGEPVPHRALVQGPHPHCLRVVLGAETTKLHGTRV